MLDDGVVSDSDYVVQNDCMIVNDELERMWKGAALAKFKVVVWTLPEETEENHGKPHNTYLDHSNFLVVLFAYGFGLALLRCQFNNIRPCTIVCLVLWGKTLALLIIFIVIYKIKEGMSVVCLQ